MALVDVGELYRATYTVTDASGALSDATVSLAITLPDQTTAAPGSPFTPIHDSLGQYHVDFATATVGLHTLSWTSTSPTTAGVDWLEVRRFVSLISLSDAKAHLNEQGTGQDEEIRSFMETATEVVESIVGPCIIRTFTDRVRTGGGQLLLPRFPVVSVTSVTSVRTPSTTYATAELDVDLDAGVVSLNTGWGFTDGPWNVVYKAGRSIIPARFVQADKEMLWHLWTTQRGALADSTTPDLLDVAQFESPLGVGFAIPNRVMELLGADRTPGFA